MSRRISFRADMTDRDLTISTLKSLNYNYTDDGGEVITITSGPLARASINLKTGALHSDSDYHTEAQLGGLRQGYSEAALMRQANRTGATVESRHVNERGEIKLRVRMTA